MHLCDHNGQPHSPNYLSIKWKRATAPLGLPAVKFHALRHSHASALIAAGVDVVTVSRRLGHGSPVITLNTYAHLFAKTDETAASAIEAVLKWSTKVRSQSGPNFPFLLKKKARLSGPSCCLLAK